MAVVNNQAQQMRVNKDGTVSIAKERQYVVVSGYYGFDNLGDEAILEELTNELKKIVKPDKIVVLSANPKKTSERFGVGAMERTDLFGIADLLKISRLFISGGGGLFQNTRSLGSVLFYGFQMILARSLGAPILIYAQGIGPLRGKLAELFTKKSFAAADSILVRDNRSREMVESWGMEPAQTADPVWCLEPKKLPAAISEQLDKIPTGKLIGLSLRTSSNFSDAHVRTLVESMQAAVPQNAHVLLLPLQNDQDCALLREFLNKWQAVGRTATLIDTSSIQYPSEWISLIAGCKLVIGMRLHALIMALKAGVPVVGIEYDPKVSQLLTEFEQPSLILTKEPEAAKWEETLKSAFTDLDKLSRKAMKKAEAAKKLACQNFNMLARILETQRYS